MERLICAVCGHTVPGREGPCKGCDSPLGIPGAVIVVVEPDATSPGETSPGIEAVEGSASGRSGDTDLAPGTPPRTFVLLTPWSERIEIPDGTSLGLGRDPLFSPCAGRLADALFVSRTHLILRAEAGMLYARDWSSKNGTRRNGSPIAADVETPLVSGDSINLGGQVTFFVA